MIRVAILGASGFVGGELLRLIAGHPELRATRLFGDSRSGQSLAQVHPHLARHAGDPGIETYSPDALGSVDLVFAALPHGETQKIAGDILRSDIAFVDLGADFRLADPEAYRTWYHEAHRAPELQGRFAYGIPEINRQAIAASRAVAAAGCYPTAAILALKPLVDCGLVERGDLIVDAASGVSGAGRAAKEATSFASVDGAFAAYGLLNHRHTAEMEQELGATILFTPHLAPMNRGILATCYGTSAGPGDPLEILKATYRDEPFVHVTDEAPSTKWVAGSNVVQVTARRDERTGRILAIAAIDNLVKGAAGQMIQCANIMLGLDETAGLPLGGMWP